MSSIDDILFSNARREWKWEARPKAYLEVWTFEVIYQFML